MEQLGRKLRDGVLVVCERICRWRWPRRAMRRAAEKDILLCIEMSMFINRFNFVHDCTRQQGTMVWTGAGLREFNLYGSYVQIT